MTFSEFLEITNRPVLDPAEYPLAGLFLAILSDINPQDLGIVLVDSDAARTSVEAFDGETNLVWDARYHQQLVDLLSVALFAPVPDSFTITESAIVTYLVDFCRGRGRSDVAHLIASHRGFDWEYLINPDKRTGFAGKALTLLEQQVTEEERGPSFKTFAEAEAFLRSLIPFGPPEIAPVLQVQLRTMAAFIFTHELGHYVLDHDQPRLAAYDRLSETLLDEKNFDERYWPEDHLMWMPEGVSFKYGDDGKLIYADSFLPQEVLVDLCRRKFASSAEVREEVYCDWFAIDWLIEALVPMDGQQLQFAEIEQSLWLCHQYKKYLSLLRHDLLGHMEGTSDSRTSILDEYQVRGLLQHARLRQLMYEPGRHAPVEMILNHRNAISCFLSVKKKCSRDLRIILISS